MTQQWDILLLTCIMTSQGNITESYHSSLMVESTQQSQITNGCLTVQVLAYLLSNYLSAQDNNQIDGKVED